MYLSTVTFDTSVFTTYTVTNPFHEDASHTILDAFYFKQESSDAWQFVIAGTTSKITLGSTIAWSSTVKHGYLFALDPVNMDSCYTTTLTVAT